MTNIKEIELQIDKIEELETKIDSALAENDSIKANQYYIEQQALYRKLPDADQPIVGRAGRNV